MPYRAKSVQESGVQNPGVIDLVVESRLGEAVLIMIDDRPWDGSQERLLQLQAKLNSYAAFALDGEMIRQYPQFEGHPIVVQLDCSEVPDEATIEFLKRASGILQQDNIKFRINVR